MSVCWASDAISVDQAGKPQREFGPVAATCATGIHLDAGELLELTVTTIGGTACTISLAE